MRFDELLYSFIEEERSKNTWKVLLPKDAILDEFYLSAKEHIYATNPNGMIIIDNVLKEEKKEYKEFTTKSFNDTDISKCDNANCDMRNKCYRYTSDPNPYWQSYSEFTPIGNVCDGYWEI
jgi:hypothetical protein